MHYLDMLTRLGVGSAHPGGFEATLKQLRRFPPAAGSRILDVGCGTGRTACHLAKLGCDTTGLDLRSDMLAKAERRAASEQLDVQWVQGNITALPFEEASFDIVIAESVTNFADIPSALAEYRRVLKPGGWLYDRELFMLAPLPREAERLLCEFFGFEQLLSEQAWLEALRAAGFSAQEAWDRSMLGEHLGIDPMTHPDALQFTDSSALLDPELWQLSMKHDDLLAEYRPYLGHALWMACI